VGYDREQDAHHTHAGPDQQRPVLVDQGCGERYHATHYIDY